MLSSRAVDLNASFLGVPVILLMENAGRRIAEKCGDAKNVVVFAGRGGNGGDALVCARHLHNWGRKVKVYYLAGERSRECQKNLDILLKLDVASREVCDSSECETIRDEVKGYDLVVDGLLGVGVSGEVREPTKSLIELINSLSAKKLSIDIPSGSGDVIVKADVVVSLHTSKAPDAVVVDIGIPPEAEKYCGPGDVYTAIPLRDSSSHKGDFGRVLVCGGSSEYYGAPYLAAKAALAVGVDLSYLATPKQAADKIPFDADLIPIPLECEKYLCKDDVEKILENKFDVIVVGNGIGVNDDTKDFVRKLAEKATSPLVVDADALKLLKKKHLKSSMVLTPHAREFEALFGEYDSEKREKLTERYAKKTDAVILLKGGLDVVSDGKTTRLNKTGNPAMTVGGTGDVLAGAVGGLLAQNKDPLESACAGAFLTGYAGDLAYAEKGVSMTATDVLNKIPEAIKKSLDI